MQAASGVGQHEFDLAGACAFDAVEDHCTRIAALVASHQLAARALRPRGELLCCGGTEGVARRHQHSAAKLALLSADLANGGGFAHTIDADKKPYVWRIGFTWLEPQRPIAGAETTDHVGLQGIEQCVWIGEFFGLHPSAQPVE